MYNKDFKKCDGVGCKKINNNNGWSTSIRKLIV